MPADMSDLSEFSVKLKNFVSRSVLTHLDPSYVTLPR